jgi:type IV pilus assembly protein PilC
MATATAAARRDVKEYTFLWEGVDRSNRQVRGEVRAPSQTVVTTNLRRQGIRVVKIKKQTFRGGRKVTEKDITFFTRQLATMLGRASRCCRRSRSSRAATATRASRAS